MNRNGEWEAANCNTSYPFMCKFPLASAPSIPLQVVATAAVRSADLVWSPPATDGGRPIAGYEIYDQDGNRVGPIPCPSAVARVQNLIPDRPYNFTVRAVNSVGPSAHSDPSNTIYPLPSAPDTSTIVLSCVAGNGFVSLSYTGGYDGGRPILSWIVSSPQTSVNFSEYQSFFVVPASNGVADIWSLTLRNSIGSSVINCPNAITPTGTAISVPTGVTGSALFRSTSVQWTPVADATVTGYRILVEEDIPTPTPIILDVAGRTSASGTVMGLVTNTTYKVAVAACISATSCSLYAYGGDVTPGPTVPDAPINATATASGNTATVTWVVAPDGDSPIYAHNVTCTPDSGIGNTETVMVFGPLTSSAGVTRLSPNTNYSCAVSAHNWVGSSVIVNTNSITTEAGWPLEPTNVTAAPGGRAATVSWLAPLDDGVTSNLAALTSFIVRSIPPRDDFGEMFSVAANCPAIAPDSQCGPVNFPGLTEGVEYRFTVEAVNNFSRTSAPSVPSNPITPTAVIPRPSTAVTAVAGRKSANISWTPPTDTGGSPITSYIVISSTGARVGMTDGNTTMAHIRALPPNVQMNFTILAVNMIGEGLPSMPSNIVTIQPDVPNAPDSLSVSAGDKEVKISFLTPDNGGSPILSYTILIVNSTMSFSFNATAGSRQTMIITGLVNGQPYRFQAYATNIIGNSVLSDLSPVATPNKKSQFKQWALAVGLVILILAIIIGLIVGLWYARENKMLCWDDAGASKKDSGGQELTSKGQPTSSPPVSPAPKDDGKYTSTSDGGAAMGGATTTSGGSGMYPDLSKPAPTTTDEEAPVIKNIGADY
jgi:titin